MLEIFLWATLIGGVPTAGYYLFAHGKQLYAHGKRLKETLTQPDEAAEQNRMELLFSIHCCIWATAGLVVCHLLKSVANIQ